MAIVAYKKFRTVQTSTWDAKATEQRLRRWASGGSARKEDMDWARYRQGFGVWDPDAADSFSEYKYPHHDVVDGSLVTPTKGVQTAMSFLMRDEVLSAEDHRGLYNHLARHYADAGMDVPEYHRAALPADATPGEVYERLAQMHTRPARIEMYGDLRQHGGQQDALYEAFQERVGLDPEVEPFLFSLIPSTQALDSYGTRMAQASMMAYRANATEGVPLMNSHRTGGWFSDSELPLGYSFDGMLEGQAVDETPLLQRQVKPEQVNLDDTGLSLRAWSYVVPDYWPNGQAQPGTNDLIKGVSSRSIRAISIGFGGDSHQRVGYACGLCGNPIARGHFTGKEEDCFHIPLVRDEESGLLAFAWVRDARMYEMSTVWAGATPGAIVEMARRAAINGRLTGEAVDMLQELWGERILPPAPLWDMGMHDQTRRVVMELDTTMDGEVTENPGSAGTERYAPPAGSGTAGTEWDTPRASASIVEGDVVISGEGVDDEIETREPETEPEADVPPAPNFDAMERSLDRIANMMNDLTLQVGRVQEGMEGLGERVASLEAARAVEQGQRDEVRADLIEQAVQARTRAMGATFDVDLYRKMMLSRTLEEVRSEIAAHEALTRKVFRPGRVTAGADERQAPKRHNARVTAAQYRGY
jgi:hypothetical protein